MRYSLIHHDVREKFGLSVGDYLVCDSIHQLSHGAPTNKPNTHIAKFIGVDEGTVRHAKTKLLKKGLVIKVGEAFTTTPLWADSVTFARNNSEQTSEKYRPSIMNIDKIPFSKEKVRLVKEDQDGKEVVPKQPRVKDPAWPLYQKCLKMVEEDCGFAPATGIMDFVGTKRALKFLDTDENVIDMLGDALRSGASDKAGHSLGRIFSNAALNKYKQDYL